jgi:hypothetical protein
MSTYTDADGNYTMTLPVGEYALTASRYGWATSVPVNSDLLEDEVESVNFSLSGAEAVTVSGTVLDGSDAQWPLYAKVTVSVPGDTFETHTNPETGAYTIPLYEGTTVKFKAEALNGGYLPLERDVLPSMTNAASSSESFDLSVNPNCTAEGYALDEPGFMEMFEGAFPPVGWAVTDDTASGYVWTSSSVSTRGNLTGTSGNTAFIDSDAAGFILLGSQLISPVLNVADLPNTNLSFSAYHRTYTGGDKLELDIKVDGGEWVNIDLMANNGSAAEYFYDLSQFIGEGSTFQLRWNYADATYEWFAAVDDVIVGTPTCKVQPGQMVTGYVHDANFDTALNGASVKVDGVAVASTEQTMDSNLNDGFFHTFISDDAESIEISMGAYETKQVSTADLVLDSPVMLKAGLIESGTDKVELTVTQGREFTDELIMANVGGLPANYELMTVPGSAEAESYGIFHSSARHFGPKNLSDLDTKNIRHFPEIIVKELASPSYVSHFILDQAYGWGIGINKDNQQFFVGDVALAGAPSDALFEYDANGVATGNSVETAFVGDYAGDLAYNGRTKTLWQVNVGGDNCIHEIDPTDMVVTGRKICPNFTVAQRGLAFDPITNTFYSGSWTDGAMYQFDTSGTILRKINVDLSVSGLAFHPVTGELFVANNQAAEERGSFDIYVLDTNTAELNELGGFNVALDVDSDGSTDLELTSTAGLAIGCDGTLWAVDQELQVALGFESGTTGACNWSNVEWLSLENTTGTIDVESQKSVGLTGLAVGEVGTHTATVVVSNDTPYGALNIPVELTIEQPNYGELGFATTSVSAKNGDAAELTVSRVNGDDFAVSIDYKIIGGTAEADVHYVVSEGTLS